jgi:hypothetical protein
MRKLLILLIVLMLAMVGVAAQTKPDSIRSFQEKVQASVGKTNQDASFVRETSYSYPADEFKPGVVRVGPRTTYLKEGHSTGEVVR